jgi:hypothetical protein
MRRTVSIFLASALLAVSVPFASAQTKGPGENGNSKKPQVDNVQFQPDPVKHREVISQPGARITANSDGLIRVTRAQLDAAGFNTSSNSANWQLFREGVELPIIVGANAEYIEFLGKALDAVESDTRTYYLTVGTQAGKRITATAVQPKGKGGSLSSAYQQTTVRKERFFYANQILNGPRDNFFGTPIVGEGNFYDFDLTGVDRSRGDRTLTVVLQGFSLVSHSVQLKLNGNVLAPVTGVGREVMTMTYTIPVDYLLEGYNSLEMSAPAAGDITLFDHILIGFPRKFIAEGDRLDFATERNKGAQLSGFSSDKVRIFDVTSETAVTEIVGASVAETDGTFGPVVPAGDIRSMYATEASNIAAPISVTANNPEFLGVPSQSANLVIIAHPSLMGAAQAWRNYRANQGVAAKLVDVTDIFDEFSYGISSSDAIEAFLNYAKNNWEVPPGYVLLIGDASYDPRDYLGYGNWNMVPTRMSNTRFEETGSDEALADFNDDGLAEIPIGRIAARTPEAVITALSKTSTWEQGLGSSPLDRGALFAYDQLDGYDFQAMTQRIMAKLPAGMEKVTVQRGIPDNASAQSAVISALNSGKYVANYSGHGHTGAWRDQNFFDRAQIQYLTNANSPTLITSLTCLNAYFVSPSAAEESFAERLMAAPNGGAVAMWASTGKTTPDVQEVMALRFYEQLGLGNIPRLGDLIRDAKGQLNAGSDVRLSWTLLGDPMLKVR